MSSPEALRGNSGANNNKETTSRRPAEPRDIPPRKKNHDVPKHTSQSKVSFSKAARLAFMS